MPPIEGIDVSHHQGTIDWAKVKASGVRFVYMKATEGRTYRDPNYATYRAGAQAVGLITGAYHFARPDLGDPATQARNFMATMRKAHQLPAMLDIENGKGIGQVGLTAWCDEFIATLQRDGWKAGWYSYPAFLTGEMDKSPTLMALPYWGADYQDAGRNYPAETIRGPRVSWVARWDIHQWTSSAKIPGIKGPVDKNRINPASPLAALFAPVHTPDPKPKP